MKRKWWLIPLGVLLVLAGVFFGYTSVYYHADAEALAALQSDAAVAVTETDYGWRFDGPAEADALIFYPGAKVEETAYAPLLHRLAAAGVDVCLVKMPFHLAFFGLNAAEDVMAEESYVNYYLGGHSLGGAMAAVYAADHGEELAGVVLCAAYPTKPLDAQLKALTIYGSDDGVLNMEKLAEGERYVPAGAFTYVIEGGNHAQFGDYGEQSGDGAAEIDAEDQQSQTVQAILDTVG